MYRENNILFIFIKQFREITLLFNIRKLKVKKITSFLVLKVKNLENSVFLNFSKTIHG